MDSLKKYNTYFHITNGGEAALSRCQRLLAIFTLISLSFSSFCVMAAAEEALTVTVLSAAKTPHLDGKVTEWQEISATKINLTATVEGMERPVPWVEIKGVYDKEFIYFNIHWPDSTESREHKPYVWDEKKKRYMKTQIMEDRMAIQFQISGTYTTDWFSGSEFEADMWHWKAFRSEALGIVHDKKTIISKSKLLRAFSAKAKDGSDIYIKRASDAGDKIYKSKRYVKREKDTMPKYILNYEAKGSVTDIKSRAAWRDGFWSVELKRALNT